MGTEDTGKGIEVAGVATEDTCDVSPVATASDERVAEGGGFCPGLSSATEAKSSDKSSLSPSPRRHRKLLLPLHCKFFPVVFAYIICVQIYCNGRKQAYFLNKLSYDYISIRTTT